MASALALLAAGGAVGLAVGWALGRTVEGPDVAVEAPSEVTYEVAAGEVADDVTYSAVATWPRVLAARNRASGTVTSVDLQPGALVAEGDRLYSVDLRPVVAAAGSVPMFRELSFGAEGADVRQLRGFLARLGHLAASEDDDFDGDTARAVRAWQAQVGVADDGVVRPGDLVMVPELPARLVLGEAVTVGATVAGGEEAVHRLGDVPTFVVPLTADQAGLVRAGMAVAVEHPGGEWEGEVASTVTGEDGLTVTLAGVGGGAPCGDECGAVPIDGETPYRVRVVLVPARSGPVVPVAALVTSGAGQLGVVLADGRTVPVEVVASANGLAVVEGLEVGAVVRIPAGAAP